MKSVGEASEEDNGDDSCWYRCDDSRVSQVEKHHVQRAQVCFVFAIFKNRFSQNYKLLHTRNSILGLLVVLRTGPIDALTSSCALLLLTMPSYVYHKNISDIHTYLVFFLVSPEIGNSDKNIRTEMTPFNRDFNKPPLYFIFLEYP